MIIRSQDKKLLIPLDKFTIGTTKDNYVCATSNLCVSTAEIKAGVLGKYSTEEKAVKVLDMICEKYKEPIVRANYTNEESLIYANSVFQMPQDSEV